MNAKGNMSETIIRADTEEPLFKELAEYKQLLYFFTWREYKIRYKQTFVGILWVILQPLMFAGIISLVLARRPELSFGFENASDIVVIFLGFSLWQFFEGSLTGSVKGIDDNRGLAKKIYVPNIIFILGPVLSRVVDLVLKLGLFAVLVFITGSQISVGGYLVLILVSVLLGLIAAAIGLIFGPLNVRWRDISLTLPFVTRLLFFTTPIWYPFSLIPEQYHDLFLLNPIVSTMELARNAFFDTAALQAGDVLTPVIEVAILVAIGVPIFKKTRSIAADYY